MTTSRLSSFAISFTLLAAAWFPLYPTVLHADPVKEALVRDAHQQMEAAAGGAVSITISPSTGVATFVAASTSNPIPTLAPVNATPTQRAQMFLQTYGKAFAIADDAQLKVQQEQGPDEVGMEHVRFRQVYNGIPVTGGELTVHLQGAQVTAVSAKTLPGLETVETTPTVSPETAQAAAREVLAKHLEVTDATLSTPRLEIFNRGLLEGRQSPTRLVWFIEATKIDVREFIWIDAQHGGVLLHFSQLTGAKSRKIYTANSSSTLPGTLLRSEGGPATGDVDADTGYDFSGDTYDYYFTQHGRDSYDGAGAMLTSTVHYCPSPSLCPYDNAFWDGTQMVYGDGFSRADDVDAHELTHAVTEHSANLFYYMQSGALNESFSDIFGETVDLTNGHGTDTPAVRWQIGEDIPGFGAFRNMMNPTLFGDPGKVSDAQFFCETFDPTTLFGGPPRDAGGVHINSGVPNHAYALMVDGGTYNGKTIAGIGLTKAGKIQYRTLIHYLLSASDFLDNYNAVQQACTDLIGVAGITAANCTAVKKALDAVEMANSVCGQPTSPALCPAGQNPNNLLFFDDLENPTSGKWTTNTLRGINHWTGCTGTPDIYCPGFATSGNLSFWGFDYGTIGDSVVAMVQNVGIPADARLQFSHSYGFENGPVSNYDGGIMEYSTNGGVTWLDAGSLISAGAAYNGSISSSFGNPLGGRTAFVRESFGYTATQLNLSSLAGQNARFRFRLGTDSSFDDYGWLIDDVRIYTCPCNVNLRGGWSSLNQTCTTIRGRTKCTIAGLFMMENNGTQKAKASSTKFYLSTDATLDSSDTLVGTKSVSALLAGQTKTLSLTKKLPVNTTAIGKRVIAVMDVGGKVSECNETDNIMVSDPIP